MNDRTDPMSRSQLRLQLDRDAQALFDEPTRREIVELLALLLSTATTGKTSKEASDETRGAS